MFGVHNFIMRVKENIHNFHTGKGINIYIENEPWIRKENK